MYKTGLVLWMMLQVTECRVHCQDSHASPWIPLGYSCPVMCQNILNAIEKLKIMDYRKMLEDERKNRNGINGNIMNPFKNVTSEIKHLEMGKIGKNDIVNYNGRYRHKKISTGKSLRDQKYGKDAKTIRQEHKHSIDVKNDLINTIDNRVEMSSLETRDETIDNELNFLTKGKNLMEFNSKSNQKQNEDHITDIEISKQLTETFAKIEGNYKENFKWELKAFENRSCDWFKSKQPYVLLKKIIRKCNARIRRNGYSEDFLRTLTRTMNRFSKASFEFTEDMVELVLERVFGKMEIREEILDVRKLLHYLRNAMELHKQHRHKDSTIILKPRHCLSVSVPGCFCRPGFVENSGQCVKPVDCISDASNEDYLTRIIVH